MLFFVTLSDTINLFYEIDGITHFSKKGMTIAFFCITGFLTIRSFQTKHLPLGNSYESMIFLSWGFSLLYSISNVDSKKRLSGAILAPSAMLIHAFATLSLPQKMQQSMLLVPALQSQWLMTHVSTTLISYATLVSGSLLAIVLLSIFYGEIKSSSVRNFEYNYGFKKRNCSSILRKTIEKQITAQSFSYSLYLNSQKCQLINCLDKWAYHTISVGFSFLTIGILSGAVWANEAWGSYWSWDPKETWALITWLIYAVYLHTRINQKLMGNGPAITASMGFFLVWICFLGVNLLGVGLHSYGWFI
uniref:Cytochrome c biogenesis protein CcsA n=1 Tax=Acrostichum speciosum TaxID=366450 RepID=A0A7M1VGQ7_9MONI|nr:CcsA [Acrostichum speciosum]QOS04077.1 CcsA [Acrostichum speciosum]